MSGGTSARVAVAALLMLLVAPAAASAQAPVPGVARTAGALLGGAAPSGVPAHASNVAYAVCRGTSSRSGPRAQAAAVRCLVNRARARVGLRPMRGSRTLRRAARRHARDMGRRRFFSHHNTRGRSPAARARAAGWRGSRIGEALAFSCGTDATPMWVVTSWLNSPGHRAIVLSGHLSKIGVGVAHRAPTRCSGGKTYALEAGR